MRLAVALAVLAAACQTGTSSPPAAGSGPPPAGAAGQPKTRSAAPGAAVVAMLSKAETDELCNAFERSGAATDAAENRDYLIANYLSKSIRSDTGHAWLINFARLGADKAARVDALTRAAKDAGLSGCPLVTMWQ